MPRLPSARVAKVVFRKALERSAARVVELSESADDKTALAALKIIFDHGVGRPAPQKAVETNQRPSVNLNIPSLDQLHAEKGTAPPGYVEPTYDTLDEEKEEEEDDEEQI